MPYQRFLISVLRECQFSRDTVPDQINNKLFKNLNEAYGKKIRLMSLKPLSFSPPLPLLLRLWDILKSIAKSIPVQACSKLAKIFHEIGCILLRLWRVL